MDKSINLILCNQGHLPSGAAEDEFEAFYNNEIKPLVSALDKHPRINITFHYSGVVLYWIERRHPELFMLIEDLLSRKQAEFLGGGFYNPILPILPMADKIGQIEMLTTYLRKHFGKKPKGCWLPSMAWEQNLVGPLTSCGMSFTFLEDWQFSGAGLKPGEGGVFFPCITEDQGKLITIFPVASATGRKLLKEKPLLVLEQLRTSINGVAINGAAANSVNDETIVVIPLEAALPGKDYEELFDQLSKADPRFVFKTPSKLMDNLHGLKKVYFSGGCPAVQSSGYGAEHGANSRQFLSSHPEAGGIYAKMIHVHTLINNQLRGDKTRKRTATEELWKAQDSGVSHLGTDLTPGLLRSPVRKAAYRALLEAEKITREKAKFKPSLSVFDFDLDGEGEYIFQDDKLNCFIKPRGAAIFELDYLPCTWNYLDTISLSGERRSAFADWLLPANTRPDDLGPGGAKGGRFCGAENYEATETDRVSRKAVFSLPPKPHLPWGDVEIEKTWQLKKNSLSLEYALKNTGSKETKFIFSPSIDLSFPGEGDSLLKIQIQREGEKENIKYGEAVTLSNIRALEFQDIKNEALISLEQSRSSTARLFQIRSGSPGREEYQSTCFMPMLAVSLESGKTWKVSFSLKISS